jgi:hypothetical protein
MRDSGFVLGNWGVVAGSHHPSVSLLSDDTEKDRRLSILRINLSYVLHESSSSATVGRFAKQLLVNARAATRATRRIETWTEERFLPTIVIRDERVLWDFQRDASPFVLTIDLGASSLLHRALHLVLPSTCPAKTLWSVDRWSAEARSYSCTLFRAETTVAVPASSEIPAWFALLVFRPGWRSMLLDLSRLSAATFDRDLVRTLERVIRDYTDQWWCWRPWWPVPAEKALPELQGER